MVCLDFGHDQLLRNEPLGDLFVGQVLSSADVVSELRIDSEIAAILFSHSFEVPYLFLGFFGLVFVEREIGKQKDLAQVLILNAGRILKRILLDRNLHRAPIRVVNEVVPAAPKQIHNSAHFSISKL